jgi:hypothetical protein
LQDLGQLPADELRQLRGNPAVKELVQIGVILAEPLRHGRHIEMQLGKPGSNDLTYIGVRVHDSQIIGFILFFRY